MATLALFGVAGGGAWWFLFADRGDELGTEAAVTAGVKRAAKLSGKDPQVAEAQDVYGPSLFTYVGSEEEVVQGADGAPMFANQVLVHLEEEAEFKAVQQAADELDATVVGVNDFTRTYQLRLSARLDEDGLDRMVAQARALEGIEDARTNPIVFLRPASDGDPQTSDSDGAAWLNAWGAEFQGGVRDIPAGTPLDEITPQMWPGNWGLQASGAPLVWNYNAHDPLAGTVVGVMDIFPQEGWPAGLDPSARRQDIRPQVKTNIEHGPHVAGTIAANLGSESLEEDGQIRGLAPNAELRTTWWGHKGALFSGDKFRFGAGVYEVGGGITYLAEAKIGAGPRAINLSLGAGDDDERRAEHAAAAAEGRDPEPTAAARGAADALGSILVELVRAPGPEFLLITPSGNESCPGEEDAENDLCKKPLRGTSGTDMWALLREQHPAELGDRMIIVGSYAPFPGGGYTVAPKSNAGADILAPGELIRSLGPGGNGSVASGTSMAAPHVAAGATVLWGINDQLSAPQVKHILESSGTVTPSLTWGNKKYGRISDQVPALNLPAAMHAAIQTKGTSEEDVGKALNSVFASDVPPVLQGAWCPADQIGAKGGDCLDLAALAANPDGPQLRVDDDTSPLTAQDSKGTRTVASTFQVCLDGDCAQPEDTIQLTYYPPGAEWECVQTPEAPGCDAEHVQTLTAQNGQGIVPHDIGWPRLVQHFYKDGVHQQSEPLLLNLMAEEAHSELPSALTTEGLENPRLPQLQHVGNWQEGGAVIVEANKQGATLIPLPDGEEERQIWTDMNVLWVGDQYLVTTDGEAYSYQWDYAGGHSSSFTDPVPVNADLELTKPVAEIYDLTCDLCESTLDNPDAAPPAATVVLYQDGSAEFIPTGGTYNKATERQAYGPTEPIASMDMGLYNMTFLTASGSVYRSYYDNDPVRVEFPKSDLVQACEGGANVFALDTDGVVWEHNSVTAEAQPIPAGESRAVMIDCARFAYGIGRAPAPKISVFGVFEDGSLKQYVQVHIAQIQWFDIPTVAQTPQDNAVAVQDNLALLGTGQVLPLDDSKSGDGNVSWAGPVPEN